MEQIVCFRMENTEKKFFGPQNERREFEIGTNDELTQYVYGEDCGIIGVTKSSGIRLAGRVWRISDGIPR